MVDYYFRFYESHARIQIKRRDDVNTTRRRAAVQQNNEIKKNNSPQKSGERLQKW